MFTLIFLTYLTASHTIPVATAWSIGAVVTVEHFTLDLEIEAIKSLQENKRG